MGKSVWKDLFREIKRTFGRFIAIFAIVAIGVAFFAGVTASSNDMKNSTDNYYDDYNMSDLRLLSSIGFNEDDINVIREVQGVKGLYPAPLGPNTTANSPLSILKSTPFNALIFTSPILYIFFTF